MVLAMLTRSYTQSSFDAQQSLILEKIVARMRKVESSEPDFGAFLVHVVEFGEPEILSALLKLLANSSSLGRNVNEAILL